MKLFIVICFLVPGLAAAVPSAAAEAGEEIYRDKCARCHDAGADKAPRIGVPEDWKARFSKGRESLLRSAIKGVPGTAMGPKGGFFQLADAEVAHAVDYMLARAGFNPEDAATARSVREALERAHIFGVRVESPTARSCSRGWPKTPTPCARPWRPRALCRACARSNTAWRRPRFSSKPSG